MAETEAEGGMTSEAKEGEEEVTGVKEATKDKKGTVIIDPIKETRKLFLTLHQVQFNSIQITSN